MDRYTQLSPKMKEKWNEDMKRVKEELDKMDYKQLFKQVYGFEVDEIKDYTFEMEYVNYYEEESKEPSTESRISILKSQLKYCKNPLQKLNMEREMNRLIRERNRR